MADMLPPVVSRLVAEIEDFVRGWDKAAETAEKDAAKIRAASKAAGGPGATGSGGRGSTSGLEAEAAAAEKAAASLARHAEAAERAARETERLGQEAHRAADYVQGADGRFRLAAHAVKDLTTVQQEAIPVGESLRDGVDRYGRSADQAGAHLRSMVGQTGAAKTGLADLGREASAGAEHVERLGKGAEAGARGTRRLGEDVKGVGQKVGEAGEEAASAAGRFSGFGEQLAGAGRGGGVLTAALVVLVGGVLPAVVAAALAGGVAVEGLGIAFAVGKLAAKGYEQAVKSLHPAIHQLEEASSRVVAAGLSQEFRKTGQAAISLKEDVVGVASAEVDLIKGMTQWLRSAEGISQVRTLLGGVRDLLEHLRAGAQAGVEAFVRFGAAAAPSMGRIGDAISSVFQKLRDVINEAQKTGQLKAAFDAGAQAVSAFGDVLKAVVAVMIKVAAQAGPQSALAIREFGRTLEQAGPMIADVTQFLAMLVLGLLKLVQVVTSAYNGIQRIRQALGPFGKSLGDLADNANKGAKGIDDVGTSSAKASRSLDGAAASGGKAGKALGDVGDSARRGSGGLFSVADGGEKASKGLDGVAASSDTAGKGLGDTADKSSTAGQAMQQLGDSGRQGAAGLSTVSTTSHQVTQSLDTLGPSAGQAGQAVGQGLAQGIQRSGAIAIQAAVAIANTIMAVMRQALAIRSPSQVMADEVGAHIPAGVGVGILANMGAATEPARQLARAAVEAARVGPAGVAAGVGGGGAVGARGGVVGAGGGSFTLEVGAGADSALASLIARMARTGQLKISANAVVAA